MAVGCGGGSDLPTRRLSAATTCEGLELVPNHLSLGAVHASRSASRAFEIRNTGKTPCSVVAGARCEDGSTATSTRG